MKWFSPDGFKMISWPVCVAVVTSLTLLVGGCSGPMVMSYPTLGNSTNVVPSEAKSGGTYFLAKHHLTVTVTRQVRYVDQDSKTFPEGKDKLQIGVTDPPLINVAIKAVPDRSQLIETGLLLSPNSDDTLLIAVDKSGLLTGITANADDKSALILESVVKSVYSPLLRSGREGETQTLFVGEFDPFNPRESSEINRYLYKRFQGCIEVEVEPGLWSPGCPTRYSLNRNRSVVVPVAKITVPAPGVYYRRPFSHRIHIVSGGQTRKITQDNFANSSPLFRLDIDRTAFTKRDTTIVFKNGVPTSVQVTKPSEAAEMARLPLTIAAAPLKAVADAMETRQGVYTAQANLYNSQIQALQSAKSVYDLTGQVPTFRSGIDAGTVSDFNARCAQIRLTPGECLAALGQ